MKKIEKLSLNKLTNKELDSRDMNKVKGGSRNCECGCCYASQGYSASMNGNANCGSNLTPRAFCTYYVATC